MRYIHPVDDVSDLDHREEFPAPLFDARTRVFWPSSTRPLEAPNHRPTLLDSQC
jgi:hypothetical protein